MSEFASWLVAARKQSKLSQAQLAERVGVSQAQVSQWENGRLEPKPELLAQVKEILGEPPRNAKPSKSSKASKANGAVLGFEQKLWEAADKLRGSMDPGEYKHVVLGLIFLKYISDAFEERYARLQSEQGADPEDRDEYEAANVFWVPKEARWSELQKAAKQPTIGVLVDKAMDTIEKQNPSLKGTLPKDYARPALDKPRNFAWLQHIVHHLAPTGVAGVVLANGSMSSQQSGEGVIRQNMVEADIVDCMVALPAQLFYAVTIPVCLWFLARNKADKRFRDRRGQVLFVDARKMGVLVDRVHRDLTEEDVGRIAGAYHAWRGETGRGRTRMWRGFARARRWRRCGHMGLC